MKENKGLAVFLMVMGWLAVIAVISFVSVALATAYPAWAVLVYIVEYSGLAVFGWNMAGAFKALK